MMKKLLSCLLIVCLVCSCGLDDPLTGIPDDTSMIEFSASKMRVITKAGDSAESFAEGTKYNLFAVPSISSGNRWAASVLYNTSGTETSGKIDYGTKVAYGVGETGTLDFYGVTYDSAEAVAVSGSNGDVPSVSLSVDPSYLPSSTADQFPDLMYSDNLKSKTSASGLLKMEFRHALSKLTFELVKQDESADPDNQKQLADAVVKRISIKGTGTKGSFSVESGAWTVSEANERVVYENITGLPLITVSEMLKEGDETVEMLVMPSGCDVSLSITLDGIKDQNGNPLEATTVEYKLMSTEVDALRLEQNHEYRLTITVLKNDVRIVTVIPQKYDWIDVDLNGSIAAGENVAYLGQPVYFGGLMWMDRNLGATSSDCENDWYNTIGYYYQHGRNIPYILDVDVWKTYFKTKTGNSNLRFDAGASPDQFKFPYELVYTLDDKGQKVADVLDLQYEFKVYEEIAINPGDVDKDYRFILGLSPNLAIASHSWAVQKTDVASNHYYYVNNDASTTKYYYKEDPRNSDYWSSKVENQPCPKGWRLPTREDLYGFMPEFTGSMTWQSSYTKGTSLKGTSSESPVFYYTANNGNPFDNTYTWKYFAGKFDVDKTVSPTADYSDPVPTNLGRVYGIKYEGTDKAYRVMFEQIKAKVDDDDSERLYVRVSRFNGLEDDVFEVNGSQWNLHKFDWSTPVEYMDFPLCGFFDSYGFIDDFGDGCIMRIADSDGEGRNWTIYLRNAYRGVSVGATSCRTLGDQIRCVRDINAN